MKVFSPYILRHYPHVSNSSRSTPTEHRLLITGYFLRNDFHHPHAAARGVVIPTGHTTAMLSGVHGTHVEASSVTRKEEVPFGFAQDKLPHRIPQNDRVSLQYYLHHD